MDVACPLDSYNFWNGRGVGGTMLSLGVVTEDVEHKFVGKQALPVLHIMEWLD